MISLKKVRSQGDGVEGGYYGKCITSEQSRAMFAKNAVNLYSFAHCRESHVHILSSC